MSLGCKVCDDPIARRAIDEELHKGISYVGLSKLMGYRGFPVSPGILSTHNKHRLDDEHEAALTEQPSRPVLPVSKRDASLIIKGKILDALEILEQGKDPVTGEVGIGIGILAKDLQPALSTALKAQSIEDKREQKKAPTVTFVLQLAAALGRVLELSDGMTIEGEARELSDGMSEANGE